MAKTADDERITAVIQRAIDITKNVEEPYRLKAFEIVLSKLLSTSTGKLTEKRLEPKLLTGTKKGDVSLAAKIAGFAEKCGLSSEQINSVFDFQNDAPYFTVPIQRNNAEKQILVSRCLLLAYRDVYQKDWVKLNQVLAEHGIGSLQHLAENLKKHPEIFRQKGRRKGSVYKLAASAIRETYELIRGFGAGGQAS